jgi:hypothetical protein
MVVPNPAVKMSGWTEMIKIIMHTASDGNKLLILRSLQPL